MGLTVCGMAGSPFYRKICIILDEKGLPYETETLNPFQAGDDFTAQNPVRRIPLLKDTDVSDDFILPDSSVIAQYLERKYPTPPMIPTNTADYGKALWFEEYADTEMATNIGLKVFRPSMFPQMSGKEPDFEAAKKTIRERLPQIHDYLEKQLEGKSWLVGDSFSIADVSVAVQYGNLAFTGYSPNPKRWPNLAGFMARVGSKESFAQSHI
ncbi:MAG: glutathione S-transferase family protein [Kordiimonadaceae bacterium]|nr:glutathione S-transferase family protein [Kordiimonadaceae bacterium]